MKRLIALLVLLASSAGAQSLPPALAVVFGADAAGLQGQAALPIGKKVYVEGPLLQVAWPDGGFVSFSKGTLFEVTDNGGHPHIHIWTGGVNAMQEGAVPLTLSGPQGKLEMVPGSAITLSVGDGATAGRVMAGQLLAQTPEGERVFGTDEGFELSADGPRGTFAPPPAKSPTPADLEPAAGNERPETPSAKGERVAIGDVLSPLLVIYQKAIRSLEAAPSPQALAAAAAPAATATAEVVLPPEIILAQERVNEAYGNSPQGPDPEPEPALSPPASTPTPEPEPEFIDPVRYDVFGKMSLMPRDIRQPDNKTHEALGMLLEEDGNGIWRLEALAAGQEFVVPHPDGTFGTAYNQTIVGRGTAEHADTFSNGSVAGLGRWVGGQLEAVLDEPGNLQPLNMPNQDANQGGTSTHYVWGTQATQVPKSGSINYTLQAATKPTYYGTNPTVIVPDEPSDAQFTGSMRVDFAPGSNGAIGKYHFNGNVTLAENGQAIGYTMATAASGVTLRNKQFDNEGSLKITPTNGPGIACAGGGSCTGNVLVAPYGAAVENLGALYSIKGSKSEVGLTGAALFGK